VSEESGASPIPLVLDASVLIAIVRGDAAVTNLILGYDAGGQPLIIPALAMTAASLDVHAEETEELLTGLERLDHAMVAPLRDAEQAARLADMIGRTELDSWDAHVASVADAAVCPIMTLVGAMWRQHANDLDETLHIIEIDDPEEG
jgi:predicted nucleic acid-binding protein